MRRSLITVWVCVLFASPCFGQGNVHNFKAIVVTISMPYHFEGLYPALNPQTENHYEFVMNERYNPIQITHYNEKGEITNNKEGWAVFKLTYDTEGLLKESSFYKADGKLTLCKSLGFSRETLEYDETGKLKQSLYYNPKGKVIKTGTKGLFP